MIHTCKKKLPIDPWVFYESTLEVDFLYRDVYEALGTRSPPNDHTDMRAYQLKCKGISTTSQGCQKDCADIDTDLEKSHMADLQCKES